MSVPRPAEADTDVPGPAEPDARAIAAERLTFFADAVIAIAITLLALDLPVPRSGPNVTNLEALQFLHANRGSYLGFLISFWVIAAHWSSHHRVFRYVTRTGGRITTIMMCWLLMQVVTPFATRVLTGDGAFEVRFILYAAVQALGALLFLLLVQQVQVRRLYRPDTPRAMFTTSYIRLGALAAGFLVSIPLCFLTPYAYGCWFALPVGSAVVRRIRRRRGAGPRDD